MKNEVTKPNKTGSGFSIPLSDKANLKKAVQNANKADNAAIIARLDYLIYLMEEGEK